MKLSDLIKHIKGELIKNGEDLTLNDAFGPKTERALSKYDVSINLKKSVMEIQKEEKKSPPWYLFALKFKNKKETDLSLQKELVPKWNLLGLDLGTITTSWAAWCGLAMALALWGSSLSFQKDGATARNWAKFGQYVDWKKEGIAQGAIIVINHKSNCNSASNNHVGQANGDCSPEDLNKPNALIDIYGGNQGNAWKVSTFKVKTICAVRWPSDSKEFPKPKKVLKSQNCSASKDSKDSTR